MLCLQEEVKSLSMNPEESMSDNNVEEEKTTSAEEEIDFDADFAEQEVFCTVMYWIL